MIKKSTSANSLVNLTDGNNNFNFNKRKKKMITVKSYDSIHDALLNNEKITDMNWNNVEHIGNILSYTPISAVLKCVSERSFPVSLVSGADTTYVDLGVCLSNPENYIKEELTNEKLFCDIRRQVQCRIRRDGNKMEK
jgi:hypothetical protein